MPPLPHRTTHPLHTPPLPSHFSSFFLIMFRRVRADNTKGTVGSEERGCGWDGMGCEDGEGVRRRGSGCGCLSCCKKNCPSQVRLRRRSGELVPDEAALHPVDEAVGVRHALHLQGSLADAVLVRVEEDRGVALEPHLVDAERARVVAVDVGDRQGVEARGDLLQTLLHGDAGRAPGARRVRDEHGLTRVQGGEEGCLRVLRDVVVDVLLHPLRDGLRLTLRRVRVEVHELAVSEADLEHRVTRDSPRLAERLVLVAVNLRDLDLRSDPGVLKNASGHLDRPLDLLAGRAPGAGREDEQPVVGLRRLAVLVQHKLVERTLVQLVDLQRLHLALALDKHRRGVPPAQHVRLGLLLLDATAPHARGGQLASQPEAAAVRLVLVAVHLRHLQLRALRRQVALREPRHDLPVRPQVVAVAAVLARARREHHRPSGGLLERRVVQRLRGHADDARLLQPEHEVRDLAGGPLPALVLEELEGEGARPDALPPVGARRVVCRAAAVRHTPRMALRRSQLAVVVVGLEGAVRAHNLDLLRGRLVEGLHSHAQLDAAVHAVRVLEREQLPHLRRRHRRVPHLRREEVARRQHGRHLGREGEHAGRESLDGLVGVRQHVGGGEVDQRLRLDLAVVDGGLAVLQEHNSRERVHAEAAAEHHVRALARQHADVRHTLHARRKLVPDGRGGQALRVALVPEEDEPALIRVLLRVELVGGLEHEGVVVALEKLGAQLVGVGGGADVELPRLVVRLATLLVHQHLVRLRDVDHAQLRLLLVPRRDVGVQHTRPLLVALSDLLRRGVAGHVQLAVQVALLRALARGRTEQHRCHRRQQRCAATHRSFPRARQ
eukprot:Rhum_TRINITY_DN23079_c0_g1::Rhum_TRINITY_DN23079_c0_g1_i1::g.177083::m.177083